MKFLLELASEEIPARMQAATAEQLRARFVDGCKAAGLAHGEIVADATPRRLWLIADDVAPASAAAREERKGPSATAPEAAIAGFLRGVGLTRDQLEERTTPKGVVLFAHIDTPGREAAAILAELVPAIVTGFQWPKSMRWGAASAMPGSPRWVRPLTGIVALLGEDMVACEAFGIAAGRLSRGHRIHAPDPVWIHDPASYASQLRDAHVIVASDERRALIAAGAEQVARDNGLTVIADPGLVAENAGLTEWPVPMLGRFDPAFLAVPREVIQLTMRTNQKYFALADASGALAPAFVCVANLVANDGGKAIVAGNERVLSARLADARFFWDQDVAAGLESFVPKLSDIVFHEKLGTVADKVERVAKLARWLVESGAVKADADLAERAARLCKADLVSATVGEFPEVQGIAGRYLALAAGEDPAVADAIRDHYKPVGQGDKVPTAPVSVAVALADKLDTLVSFFDIGEKPTGSRDPFAIRRAALGFISQYLALKIRLKILDVVEFSLPNVVESKRKVWERGPRRGFEAQGDIRASQKRLGFTRQHDSTAFEVLDFLTERLKFQQRELGVRQDLIDAIFALGGEDDFVRLLARVQAFQFVLTTEDGTNLLAGVKRAGNILRIEEAKGEAFAPQFKHELFIEPAETALGVALDTGVPAMADAVAAENFTGAMASLASLRPAIDAFFDTVIVNAPDPAVRLNRLGLLARLRAAANSVADFSNIEG